MKASAAPPPFPRPTLMDRTFVRTARWARGRPPLAVPSLSAPIPLDPRPKGGGSLLALGQRSG